MRKIAELTEINKYGNIGYRFEDSKRFASAKVQEDSKGKFFISKKEKYYLNELKQDLSNVL